MALTSSERRPSTDTEDENTRGVPEFIKRITMKKDNRGEFFQVSFQNSHKEILSELSDCSVYKEIFKGPRRETDLNALKASVRKLTRTFLAKSVLIDSGKDCWNSAFGTKSFGLTASRGVFYLGATDFQAYGSFVRSSREYTTVHLDIPMFNRGHHPVNEIKLKANVLYLIAGYEGEERTVTETAVNPNSSKGCMCFTCTGNTRVRSDEIGHEFYLGATDYVSSLISREADINCPWESGTILKGYEGKNGRVSFQVCDEPDLCTTCRLKGFSYGCDDPDCGLESGLRMLKAWAIFPTNLPTGVIREEFCAAANAVRNTRIRKALALVKKTVSKGGRVDLLGLIQDYTGLNTGEVVGAYARCSDMRRVDNGINACFLPGIPDPKGITNSKLASFESLSGRLWADTDIGPVYIKNGRRLRGRYVGEGVLHLSDENDPICPCPGDFIGHESI